MEKIIIFDTAIATGNQGDDIIYNSTIDELRPITNSKYALRLGTHVMNYSPIQIYRMKSKNSAIVEFAKNSKYKFICGTNLLGGSLKRLVPQWQLNKSSRILYEDSVLVGVGSTKGNIAVDRYTEKIYKNTLSKNLIHSVRDDLTKEVLEKLGFKAINTGCPTLWGLTKEKSESIPVKKADKVIFTLSGHAHLADPHKDRIILDTIMKNYTEAFAWIQTIKDEEYIDSLNKNNHTIRKIYSLSNYTEILSAEDVDYVGTRLHGGIHAMNHGKRSIIIIIDHRARGIYETNKINAIERSEVENNLEAYINSEFKTNVVIQEDEINMWKSQFE